MNHPFTLPSTEIDIVNITKNTKGFKIRIKPIENLENIESYNIYLSDYTYNIEPDSNTNNFLIKQLSFSEYDQYFYHVPKTTGFHYLTVFCKNNLGLQSSGVLFTGIIPYQKLIKEISIENLNYYTSGSMRLLENSSITLNEPYALLGYQLNYSSPADADYTENQGFNYQDFTSYFKSQYNRVYHRVIPALENNSGILFDQTVLRNTSNDVYVNQSLGRSIEKNGFINELISISDTNVIRSPEYSSLPSDNNRYFIFDFYNNYLSFSNANSKYIQGIDNDNTILFNPEIDTTGSFLNKILNQTGVIGDRPTNYIRIQEPGHYSSYYITTEVIDEDGFSSAGGNINNNNDLNMNKNNFSKNREGFKD
jgi:hypothetical protein